MIVSQNKKLKKNCQKKRNFIANFSKNCLKLLKFTYFVDNTSKCIPEQIFFGKLQLFLTDSQKSRIHVVYLQNFSISWLKKKFKFFFCLKRPETQSKTKKLKKLNIFFKISVSPPFLQQTLVKFSSPKIRINQ